MKNRLFPIVLVLPLVTLIGCGWGSNEEKSSTPSPTASSGIASVVDDISRTIGQATDSVISSAPDTGEIEKMGKGEWEKLSQLEYKVVEIDESLKASEIEDHLRTLGNEGYDCFSIVPRAQKLLVSCKKRPKSVLNQLRALRIP